MSQLFYLSAEQLERIKPFFPRSHGIPRVDNRKVINGIIYVIKHGLSGKMRRASMARTRRSTIVFCAGAGWASSTIFLPNWQKQRGWPGDDQCDPPQGASYRRQFAQKRALSRCIGRTKGGLNSKTMPSATLTAGQVSDYKGATLLMDAMDALPEARALLADRGYDAGWFRDALRARGITPCIPPRRSRKKACPYDQDLYKQRHKIEIMFGRIKDWRRIAMRYDRCAHTFFSALCLAASVICYLD
ncbi:IS5 family transposase [Desulfobulbus oralis]|uniref:IS5 family transposase n=1 Tax=Desulfobulbus oralis TaxID=1986146 RepID=UPI000CF4449A|nr:IS5 family transposase [Desulfobulbus oralis]